VFMEDDYLHRKLDFVTEVYALLEKQDGVLAKMVMDDLIVLVPALTTTFVFRLENFVVGYEKVERVSAGIVRVSFAEEGMVLGMRY